MFVFVYIYICICFFKGCFYFRTQADDPGISSKGGGENSGYPKMTTSIGCTTSMAWFKLYQFQLGEYPMLQPDPLVFGESSYERVTVVSTMMQFFVALFFSGTCRKHEVFYGIQQIGMYMDVSENSGTPKSSTLIGFSIINHPFWGTTI